MQFIEHVPQKRNSLKYIIHFLYTFCKHLITIMAAVVTNQQTRKRTEHYIQQISERGTFFFGRDIYIYATLESCITGTSRSMMTSLQTTKNETQGSLANT